MASNPNPNSIYYTSCVQHGIKSDSSTSLVPMYSKMRKRLRRKEDNNLAACQKDGGQITDTDKSKGKTREGGEGNAIRKTNQCRDKLEKS